MLPEEGYILEFVGEKTRIAVDLLHSHERERERRSSSTRGLCDRPEMMEVAVDLLQSDEREIKKVDVDKGGVVGRR